MAKRNDRFIRLSLDYADHPKIAGLSDEAFRVHVEMILYSRRYLTDGVIAKQIAKRWPSTCLAELEANDEQQPSLVKLDDGSYMLHGYSEMQETRDEIEEKRRIRADAGRKGGLAKAKQNAKQDAKQKRSRDRGRDRDNNVGNSDESTDASRDDVQEVLDHLDELILEYDPEAKLPSRTKANINAARLMIDKDGRTVEQIKAAIRFSQDSEFWRPNIRSASKLREQYDKLRLQAQRNGASPGSLQPEQMPQFDIDGYASDSYRWYEDHDAVAEADHYGKPRPPATEFIIFPGDPATDEHLTGPNRRRVRHRPNPGSRTTPHLRAAG